MLQRKILPFEPPLVYPEEFPAGEYAANLGLALADKAGVKAGGKVSAEKWSTVSLLPPRHMPRAFPAKAVGAFAVLLVFGLLAYQGTTQVSVVEAGLAPLESRLDQLKDKVRQNRLAEARVAAFEKRTEEVKQLVVDLEDRRFDLEGMEAKAEESMGRWEAVTRGGDLASVNLAGIGGDGDAMILVGSAPGYGNVMTYAAGLRDSGFFSQVKLVEIKSPGVDEPVTFRIRALAFSDEEEEGAEEVAAASQ